MKKRRQELLAGLRGPGRGEACRFHDGLMLHYLHYTVVITKTKQTQTITVDPVHVSD